MAALELPKTALAERLRAVRRGAGLTGTALADKVGWGQPKVSKIENGHRLPSQDDILQWAAACNTAPDELLTLLERTQYGWYTAYTAAMVEDAGGGAAFQASIGAVERAATVVAAFQPNIIHGLLQTSDYAQQLMHLPGGPAENGASETEIDHLVAARIRRQALLYEPGHRITLLVGEAALHNRIANPATMREQALHLARLATTTTTHATIGIVCADRPAPMVYLHGWDQLDNIVIIETTDGALSIADPTEVARYERYLQLLLDSAITGEEAAEFCRRIAEQFGS